MSGEPTAAGTEPLTAVWSEDCLAHDPDAEIWLGVRTPAAEVPERQTRILQTLEAVGAHLVPAVPHGDELLRKVHDPGLLEQLRDVWQQWQRAGYGEVPGQDRVVPYVFPTPAMTAGQPTRVPTAVHARAGLWCYDTMTLVGAGTWPAARAAVDTALTAAGLVAEGRTRLAYALCRPPGHHAAPAGYGGSCYLNNAAVAAEALRSAGYGRVAVLDVDAHHGNGTQAVFWERGDVLYGSAHVDPGAGWFPHYLGFADETGSGRGGGTTVNVPLAPGTGDAGWLDAVSRIAEAAAEFGAEALVVSLGVDASADDPESPLQVSASGYQETGRLLGTLGLPTVAVQEGGYHLPTLGGLVVEVLTGLHG